MFIDKKTELNTKFNGSYELLKYILKKYTNELPYKGQVKIFTVSNGYCPMAGDQWRNYGVSPRVWNLLHKDLTILFLLNKISIVNLNDLQQEFKKQKQLN